MIAIEPSNLAEFVEAELGSIPGVASVEVDRNGDDFRVVAHLSSFDRAVRRKVYVKHSKLYREFPQYRFDFVNIDASDAGPQSASQEGRE